MKINDSEKFTIKRIMRFDENTINDLNGLLSQWYVSGYKLNPSHLKLVIKNSYLLGLYDGPQIIGMVTLIEMYKISGYKGSIEHLIVAEKYRGQGLGKKLMLYAIALAKELNMVGLALTCEPDRIEANALYKKLGFALKESRVYYMELHKD